MQFQSHEGLTQRVLEDGLVVGSAVVDLVSTPAVAGGAAVHFVGHGGGVGSMSCCCKEGGGQMQM